MQKRYLDERDQSHKDILLKIPKQSYARAIAPPVRRNQAVRGDATAPYCRAVLGRVRRVEVRRMSGVEV
jgi:hypothetical protein